MKWLLAAVVLLVVLGGAYFLVSGNYKASNTATPSTTESTTQEGATASADTQEEMTVRISSSGFSPDSVTIKVDGKVTFINDDSADHQVASAPHPVHTDYPKLNVGVLKPGEMGTAEFDKTGTFGYHDHLNPTMRGEVVVE